MVTRVLTTIIASNLLCCALSKVLVGEFTSILPQHFPITYNSNAFVYQRYEGWDTEQCLYNFMLSIGMGVHESFDHVIFDTLKRSDEYGEIMDTYANSTYVGTHTNRYSYAATMPDDNQGDELSTAARFNSTFSSDSLPPSEESLRLPLYVLPVRIGPTSTHLLFYYRGDDPSITIRKFLDKHGVPTDSVEIDVLFSVLLAQMNWYLRRVQRQLDAFSPREIEGLPKVITGGSDPSVGITATATVVTTDNDYQQQQEKILRPIFHKKYFVKSSAATGYGTDTDSSTIGTAIPSFTDIFAQHWALQEDFPTFVLNLWHNYARRAYMLPQLQRTGLKPVYLMPGVDSSMLKDLVLNIVVPLDQPKALDQLASSIAHIQMWREIVSNQLPFALILEDDVELLRPHTLRADLHMALRELPSDWDILILDYEVRNYWSERARLNKVPTKCVEALAEFSKDHPDQLLIRLDGLCAGGSVGSILISQIGATKLLQNSYPISWDGADVFVYKLIANGTLNAYAYVQPLVSSMRTQVPGEKSVIMIVRKHDPAHTTDSSSGYSATSATGSMASKEEVEIPTILVETYVKEEDIVNCTHRVCPIAINIAGGSDGGRTDSE